MLTFDIGTAGPFFVELDPMPLRIGLVRVVNPAADRGAVGRCVAGGDSVAWPS